MIRAALEEPDVIDSRRGSRDIGLGNLSITAPRTRNERILPLARIHRGFGASRTTVRSQDIGLASMVIHLRAT